MRELKYLLTDSTLVDSFKEAKLSGQEYKPVLIDIAKSPPKSSDLVKQCRKRFDQVTVDKIAIIKAEFNIQE